MKKLLKVLKILSAIVVFLIIIADTTGRYRFNKLDITLEYRIKDMCECSYEEAKAHFGCKFVEKLWYKCK